MSFGFSVGDFVAVGSVAWVVYKSCRDAPESFNNISMEVLSLHAVLKEVEEVITEHELTPAKKNSLAVITQGCEGILNDLQALVTKYEGLGSKSKVTWDRLKWGANDVAELRARLTSNTVLLTAFMSTTQVVVERKLNKLVREFHEGKHEGSVISTITVESLTYDEQQTWRTIRKELEAIGISVAAFESNKSFILEWFQQAIKRGDFEEHVEDDGGAFSSTDASDNKVQAENHDSSQPESSDQRPAPIKVALHQGEPKSWSGAARKSNQNNAKKPPKLLTRISRILLDYNGSFYQACENCDIHKAKELLRKGADIDGGGSEAGDTALRAAIRRNDMTIATWLLNEGASIDIKLSLQYSQPLIMLALEMNNMKLADLLLQKGADINSRNRFGKSALHCAALRGDVATAKFLLHRQADVYASATLSEVNFNKLTKAFDNQVNYTPLSIAARQGHLEIVRLLLNNGIDLSRADYNIRSKIGRAAMYNAAIYGQTEIVYLLLEKGARISDTNKTLVPILIDKHEDLACFLIKAGTDVAYRDEDYRGTPLEVAISNGLKKAAVLIWAELERTI